jgi:hypothetical protein
MQAVRAPKGKAPANRRGGMPMNKFVGAVAGGVAGLFLNLADPAFTRYLLMSLMLGVTLQLVASLVARAISRR